MDLGVSCMHSVVLQPPDAVVGWQSSRELECSQCCVGFGDYLPIGPPPIANGILGAGDKPARDTAGLSHHQSTSERGLQHCEIDCEVLGVRLCVALLLLLHACCSC